MTSRTTIKLLAYSKTLDPKFDYESILEFLSVDYHPDMKISGVMTVLLKSLTEVMNNPEYKLHYGKDFLNKVLVSPFEYRYGEAPSENQTIMDVYNRFIEEIMYGFRFTQIVDEEVRDTMRKEVQDIKNSIKEKLC